MDSMSNKVEISHNPPIIESLLAVEHEPMQRIFSQGED